MTSHTTVEGTHGSVTEQTASSESDDPFESTNPGGPPAAYGPQPYGPQPMQPMHSDLNPEDATSMQTCHICENWPSASFDWKLCDASGNARFPSRNNLGGLGPVLTDPPEIRYDNVATFNGVDMDLVVTNMSLYTPHDISRNNVKNAVNDVGVHGCFGVVNVAENSFVTLSFAFTPHGSNETMLFGADDNFIFSIWDLDHSRRKDN